MALIIGTGGGVNMAKTGWEDGSSAGVGRSWGAMSATMQASVKVIKYNKDFNACY